MRQTRQGVGSVPRIMQHFSLKWQTSVSCGGSAKDGDKPLPSPMDGFVRLTAEQRPTSSPCTPLQAKNIAVPLLLPPGKEHVQQDFVFAFVFRVNSELA